MAKIIYYPNGLQDESIISEYETLAHWVVKEASRHDELHLWIGEISKETHVNIITDTILLDPDAVYHISPSPMGVELLVSVIISVVIGVAAALIFTPNVDVPEAANSNQTSSNALQGRGNQPRLNKRLPSIRGKEPKAYPDLWMSYNKFSGNKEYEISYMCASDGLIKPEEDTIVDGETLLRDIRGQSAEFYGPNTSPMSGHAPFLRIGDIINEPLVSVRTSNEVDGAELRAPNDGLIISTGYKGNSSGVITATDDIDFSSLYVAGDKVILNDFFSFQFVPPVDPGDEKYYVRHNVSGTYEINNVTSTTLALSLTSAPNGWQYVTSTDFRHNAWQKTDGSNNWLFEPPTQEKHDYYLVEWSPSTNTTTDLAVGPFDCSDSEFTWLNFVAQNGLYKKASDVHYFTLQFRVTFTNKDSGTTQLHTLSMTSNREDSVQQTFEFDTPYPNCTITIQRLTNTDKDFNGTVIDTVKWRDLYLADPITKTEFGNVTTILSKTRATDAALRVKERKLSFAATRQMTRPNGVKTYSDEFADVIFDLHTDPFIGRATAATINHVELYSLQERIVAYYDRGRDPIRVGYTFDDDKYRYEDHLRLICDAVNVTPYMIGNVLNFFFESPQNVSVQQFGHRSKDPNGTETRSRMLYPREDYDGVELTYKDETTGDFEVIYVPADQSASNPEVVEYKGCYVKRNAQVRADRIRNKQTYQRVTHEFVSLDKARLLAQGQRVDVIDNTRYAPNNGYIDTVEGLVYYLSQDIDLPIGTQASIVLTKRDGSLEGVPCVVTDNESVTLQHPPSESPYTGHYADPTEYSLGTDDARSKLAMLVTEMVPNGTDNVSVTCINYDERYYSNDK